MHTFVRLNPTAWASVLAAGLITAGCCHPSEDNIRLRKLNQGMNDENKSLKTKVEAQQRTIEGLMQRSTSVATLSPADLKKVFVASGIKLGKLTGGSTLDQESGIRGLAVVVNPSDDNGQPVQAAGSIVVDAYDLADKQKPHIGKWTFDAETAKSQWRAFLFEFGYSLKCPWQTIPLHPEITIQVTFTDELTQIPFHAQTVVQIDLSKLPAAAPTTAPVK